MTTENRLESSAPRVHLTLILDIIIPFGLSLYADGLSSFTVEAVFYWFCPILSLRDYA